MRRASLQADVIPKMGRSTYINDYVPEPAWAALQGWADRGAMPWWPSCASRDSYLAAYRVVQAQLNPTAAARACFNNPPARSYLALHVRRGDRAKPQRRCGKECTRQGGDRPGAFAASASTVAVLLLSNSTLHALRTVSERDGRPWLVVSDNQQTRIAMELLLRAEGLTVVPPPQSAVAAGACVGLAPAEAAEAAGAAGATTAAAVGGAAVAELGRGYEATFAMLRDFFVLASAAGVVVAPLGRKAIREHGVLMRRLPDLSNPPLEGSFSTCGPLLLCSHLPPLREGSSREGSAFVLTPPPPPPSRASQRRNSQSRHTPSQPLPVCERRPARALRERGQRWAAAPWRILSRRP